MNLNMYVDYTIEFTPMNSLPEGGLIEIWFPVEYTGSIVKIYLNNNKKRIQHVE